jgi:hypothetical protein
MKILTCILTFISLTIIVSGQNIENELGSNGLFVVKDADGIPLIAIDYKGEMTSVGRTNRLITGNQVELGSVYLDVLQNANESQESLNLEFISEPPVGTEHLLVVEDLKGADLRLNLLGNLEETNSWISSDASFDLGDGTTIAVINDLNGGTNNQIVYSANVTPPGTMIKVVYLGRGLWTASTNFLSTYSPPALD